MKKLLLGGLTAACTLLMTSCLEGGSNESSNYTFGVVDFSTKTGGYVFNTGDIYPYYSPEMASDASLNIGDCCYFFYHYNGDNPANADIATTGYVTVSISPSNYMKIDNYHINTGGIDTATFVPASNELPIVKIESLPSGYIWSIIKNYMFLPTYHEILTDQKQTFSMTFDREQEPEDIGGESVYNLYLTTQLLSEGTSPTKNTVVVNAFEISSFINSIGAQVKAEGKKYVKFKINYISSLDKDKTKANWSSSDIATYTFPETEK